MIIFLLITQIGLKTENLNLCNIPSPTFLFSELDGGDYSGRDANDITWIITEPLGGILGGAAGGLALGLLLGPLGYILGWFMGVGGGIWMAGTYIEKENGSLLYSFLGSIAVLVPLFCIDMLTNADAPRLYDFYIGSIGPIITGITLYRINLPK